MSKGSFFVALGLSLIWLGASAHFHSWQKVSQWDSVDPYGNKTVTCTWKCITDYNQHQTTTSGLGYCPQPM